jgi:hypothetical protein
LGFNSNNQEVAEIITRFAAVADEKDPWSYCFTNGNKFAGTKDICADPLEYEGEMYLMVNGLAPKHLKKKFEYLYSYIPDDNDVLAFLDFCPDKFFAKYKDSTQSMRIADALILSHSSGLAAAKSVEALTSAIENSRK